jgi:hypothetical protein
MVRRCGEEKSDLSLSTTLSIDERGLAWQRLSVSAASAAIATSSVASTAAAAARTLFAWPCFVDRKRAPVDFGAIELCDCFVGFIAGHLHKSKTF